MINTRSGKGASFAFDKEVGGISFSFDSETNITNSDEAYVLPELNISFLFQPLQLASVFEIQTQRFCLEKSFCSRHFRVIKRRCFIF